MKQRSTHSVFFAAAVVLGLTGCNHEKPGFIYMPDMHYSPAYKAQEEGANRLPVEGTVTREGKAIAVPENPDEAGKTLHNPVKVTRADLKRGQQVFNTFCIVCHGPGGEGDGYIVPKFPRPPTLVSEKIRDYTDGRIFHILSKGQNLMPSYASQIEPEDRWKVIHYLRVLYRAKHPTPDDLKALETW